MTIRALLGEHILRTECGDREVSGLQYDSRRVQQGEIFFAFDGERVDGHRFTEAAISAGSSAIVSERIAPGHLKEQWVQVGHGRKALAAAALEFYGHPDRSLRLTGVTGTNGKTTTVYLIDSILRVAGKTTARIGTIDHTINGHRTDSVNTTPESLDLVRYLHELVRQDGTHATLEVSSHALALGRVHGMNFDTAVFTNLSRDHLDFHQNMEAYKQAKRSLFDGTGGSSKPEFTIINRDDAMGRDLLSIDGSTTLSYGMSMECMVRPEEVKASLSGVRMKICTPKGKCDIESPLCGDFNIQNILAATATAIRHEISLADISLGVRNCAPVIGRFEIINMGQPFLVVVDYAHTADALRNLIETARRLLENEKRDGRVLTLFGCGGDRDLGKRPVMGEIAGKLSDLVVLTSDNPRNENPIDIINDVLVGLKKADITYELEPNRHEAIRKVLQVARQGDIVLLAGKGHETCQFLDKGKKVSFDDRTVACEVLESMGYRA